VQFLDNDDHVRVIAMTSSISGEGKSVTAANLAIAIARSGQRVALVDADLRKPMIGTLFGLEDSVGLVDVLRGHAALDDVLQPWGSFELMVLPAGGATAIPSELLGTVAMTRLIAELRSRFDFVIIDNLPLVPVTDAAIVATQTDGVVLLVRPDRVTKAQFQRSLGNLERVRANLLGLVASQVSERLSPYRAGYYGTRTDEGSGGLGEMPPNDRSTQRDADPESGFLLEAALRRNPRSRSK
jgi:capsular exopolysaccharide synthesis family protein